jgi:hypothetical protein
MFDKAYWRAICPNLHVDDATDQPPPLPPYQLPVARAAALRVRMQHEGYFHLALDRTEGDDDPQDEGYLHLIHALSKAAQALVDQGWPATFLCVYDEAWALVHRLNAVMERVTGNSCMMDLVSWVVDPRLEAGFTPHRDRHFGVDELDPRVLNGSFRQPAGRSPDDDAAPLQRTANNAGGQHHLVGQEGEGQPRYCTCWVALTAAQPDNGCLYIIPRQADPAYARGDVSEAVMARPPAPGEFRLGLGASRTPVSDAQCEQPQGLAASGSEGVGVAPLRACVVAVLALRQHSPPPPPPSRHHPRPGTAHASTASAPSRHNPPHHHTD